MFLNYRKLYINIYLYITIYIYIEINISKLYKIRKKAVTQYCKISKPCVFTVTSLHSLVAQVGQEISLQFSVVIWRRP